jgi:predicted ATP-dependent Lon-type protease
MCTFEFSLVFWLQVSYMQKIKILVSNSNLFYQLRTSANTHTFTSELRQLFPLWELPKTFKANAWFSSIPMSCHYTEMTPLNNFSFPQRISP